MSFGAGTKKTTMFEGVFTSIWVKMTLVRQYVQEQNSVHTQLDKSDEFIFLLCVSEFYASGP